MIGKLQSWRGGDNSRSKEWRHSGVGGLVSIEDLAKKPKAQPAAKPAKKKVPFLSLGRSNVTLKSLQAQDEDGAPMQAPPVASDVSLFSNIPASAGLTPTFPRSETSRPASPTRPKTADPDRASFARRRSKTSPALGETPHLTLDWSDKPLPLSLDFDTGRKRSMSTNHSRKPSAQDSVIAGASIPRPRTSQSMESGPSSRKRSNSAASRTSKPTYSLTPAISPAQSRRPSLSGADIQKIAQAALSKTPSNTSTPSATRERSNSHASMSMPPPERPAPVPSPARSVLDEVGGTLSATIRELQDLQGEWDHPGMEPLDVPEVPEVPAMPMRMSSLMYRMPSPPELGAKQSNTMQEGYFPFRSHSHDAVPIREESRPPSRAPSVSPSVAPSVASAAPATPRSARPPETPSLGRMQSIQIAYEKSKSTAHKLGVENDTLKQQMKFLRERFAEIGDLKTEKETLEVALAESRRNLEAALAQLQAGKANEQALQNNFTNVSRKLEEANVQKVDVLEQNGDLQEKVCSLQKELTKMRTEAEELRQRPQVSELEEVKASLSKIEEENKLLSEQVKAAEGRADLPARVADLTFKLEDLTHTAAAKDVYIGELTSQTTALSSEMETLRTERAALAETNATLRTQSLQKHSQSTKRMSLLNKQIEDMEKARTAAVAESERHLQLLKEQLRRTANDVNKREHPASNLLEKKLNIEEAVAEVRLKFERRMAKEAECEDEDAGEHVEAGEHVAPEEKIERLEKEIEYHVKDIVLYKLDVKGYRKDLKRAKEKIAALTEVTANTNTSPCKEKRSSISSPTSANSSPTRHREVDSVSPSPATPSIATALHVQLPVRHIVSAYAAPLEIKAPMVSA